MKVWAGDPIVISEKSKRSELWLGSEKTQGSMVTRGRHTLGVQEVADRDGVATLGLHNVGVEDSIAVVTDPSVRAPHVLLAKVLNLGLDGNRSLRCEE